MLEARLRPFVWINLQMHFRQAFILTLLAGLSGCATLPTNGPTKGQIERSAKDTGALLPIRLVEVKSIGDVPPLAAVAPLDPDFSEPVVLPTDMIGSGDVLEINIYEAGVALFSTAGSGGASSVSPGTGVVAQKLPPVRVDDNGYIALPYTGRLRVRGHTVEEAQNMIRASLRGYSQNPQVLVTMRESIANTVIVGGEVVKPGRIVLSTNRESLTDVVALAGGFRAATKDILARVTRGGRITDIRLNDIVTDPRLDIRLAPGDRLTLINDPRTFSVLGASASVAQLPFSRSAINLAEAIATAGGVNANIGNPAAVFLFRYEDDGAGKQIPKVYHLNLMKTGTYFLAQRFALRDKDIIYIGNAAANQPAKLFQLISQLFVPVVTATAAVQAVN